MVTAITEPAASTEAEWAARLDGFVERAQEASAALRELDQEAVDRIVWAMTVAGLEHAVELAELAMEETMFGVLEDKVLKNYIATEFLYDYLKDKKSVGVIDEDRERALQYVAEPIGVVLALLPITNPTSTTLFKSIVCAKTRNALVMRPSPRAVRCCRRAAEVLQEAGEAVGLPPNALQVIPDPSLEVSQYLFHHPGVDFIWTTGGPKAVAAANAAGKPCLSVGPGNAPVYVHSSADIRMAVMDMLISKTFDASVICPAEQTCVIDDAIYDEVVDEFQRMGARLLTDEQSDALAARSFTDEGKVQLDVLGQSCVNLGNMAGFEVSEADKVLLAPLPSDLEALAAHPFIAEKLMPVLGLVRSPSVDHGIRACELVTEHFGLGHTSAVYANDDEVISRFSLAIRTGRILVNAPTAVGALGGVYNSMTPTFSLGCGTWGGSNTTDNVNYLNLLNIKTVSRRQTPPQWFRVPSDTYFNPGSLDSLSQLDAARPMIVTDRWTVARGVAEEVRHYLTAGAVHVYSGVEPEPTEAQIRAGIELLEQTGADAIIAIGGGSVMDAAKAMRLFHESPELSIRELSLPFLDARKRIANFPQLDHKVRLVAIPTTSGTGSEVSPAAVISVGKRKVTLVDYSLVPDMAIVDPNLTLTMPQGDHGGHRNRRSDPRARGGRVDLRLAVHGRILRAGGQPDLHGAAACLSGRLGPRGPHLDAHRRDDRRAGVLERVRRAQPCPRAPSGGAVRDRAWPRERDLPAPRAALQRITAEQVHAGARLLGLRRTGEVCGDRPDSRIRRTHRGGPARTALCPRRRSAGRGRGAANAGRLRRVPQGVREGASRSGQGGVHGPEHSHQPAHPDDPGGRRTAPNGLRVEEARQGPASVDRFDRPVFVHEHASPVGV